MRRRGRGCLALCLAWVTYVAWAYAIWGPWIPAQAVANRLLGVDMAEAVKFLPAVRAGHLPVQREIFLLSQWMLVAMLSVHAWQSRWPYSRWERALVQFAACATALSMLPPPWSPALLRLPEWRLQTGMLLSGLFMCALSPLWGRFPARWTDPILAGLGLIIGIAVGYELQMVWPEFTRIYHHSLEYGAGIWALGVGVTGLLLLPLVPSSPTPQ